MKIPSFINICRNDFVGTQDTDNKSLSFKTNKFTEFSLIKTCMLIPTALIIKLYNNTIQFVKKIKPYIKNSEPSPSMLSVTGVTFGRLRSFYFGRVRVNEF